MKRQIIMLLILLTAASILPAQTADYTLNGLINQVIAYNANMSTWTEYKKEKLRTELMEKTVNSTISMLVLVDSHMLLFDKSLNATIYQVSDTIFSYAFMSPQARYLEGQMGQFVSSDELFGGRSKPKQIEYEEWKSGDHRFRIHKVKYFRSLELSKPAFQYMAQNQIGQFSLSLRLTSASDKWAMEIDGIKLVRLFGRIKKLSWSNNSIQLEIEEVSSTF
jgi:hypothetical protein